MPKRRIPEPGKIRERNVLMILSETSRTCNWYGYQENLSLIHAGGGQITCYGSLIIPV